MDETTSGLVKQQEEKLKTFVENLLYRGMGSMVVRLLLKNVHKAEITV